MKKRILNQKADTSEIFEDWWKYTNRVHFTDPIPEVVIERETLRVFNIKQLMSVAFNTGYIIKQEDIDKIKTQNSW